MKIIKWIVLWLIGKYLPGYHLHCDPVSKKGFVTVTATGPVREKEAINGCQPELR